MRTYPLPGQRLSIRHGDVSLAVPAMHPDTPSPVRVAIFELVLRRQYGEALDLARDSADDIDRHGRVLSKSDADNIAVLISETPHATDRRHAA